MKNRFLLVFFASIMFPLLAFGQTKQTISPAISAAQGHPPTKEAKIVNFYVQEGGQGPLHIIYSDGTEVEIPEEMGCFAINDQVLTQETFSDIQVADDHQHIGWVAAYMLCQQSYPCTAALAIYQHGYKPQYISSPYGVIWRWMFFEAGKKVAVEFGFSHGNQPQTYGLYNTKTGREVARLLLRVEDKGPDWVEYLRSSKKR